MVRSPLTLACLALLWAPMSHQAIAPRLLAQTTSAEQAKDQTAKAQIAKGQTAKAELPQGKVYVYKESAGKSREIELFFPPGHDPATAKAPGIIMFHGGGWSGGVRTQFSQACQHFANRGMVAATVTYRMLSASEAKQLPKEESRKRVCVTDAKSAIRWFKQQAPQLGLDPERIVAGGGSAGGHIAMLATNNPELNDPNDPTGFDTSVVAYVLFNPAFTADDHQDPAIDAIAQTRKPIAPAIVFFGSEDTWKKGWDELEPHLNSIPGNKIHLHLARGQQHGFFNRDPWQTVTLQAADEFLVAQGLLKGPSTLKPNDQYKLEFQSR